MKTIKTEDRHFVWFCSSCNGMADNASLFVEYFGWIGFHVWENVPAGGLFTGLYLFRSCSNSISGGGFIWRFLTRWGFTLPVYRFVFLTLVKLMDYRGLVIWFLNIEYIWDDWDSLLRYLFGFEWWMILGFGILMYCRFTWQFMKSFWDSISYRVGGAVWGTYSVLDTGLSFGRRGLVYIWLGYWVVDTDVVGGLNWLLLYVVHSLITRNLSHSFFISTPWQRCARDNEGTRTGTTDISTSWSSLFSFQYSDFGFTAYVTVYYHYHFWWCTILFSLFFLFPLEVPFYKGNWLQHGSSSSSNSSRSGSSTSSNDNTSNHDSWWDATCVGELLRSFDPRKRYRRSARIGKAVLGLDLPLDRGNTWRRMQHGGWRASCWEWVLGFFWLVSRTTGEPRVGNYIGFLL